MAPWPALLLLLTCGQDATEAELSARRFRLAPGFKIELYAAEPMLQNPVCIAFDEKGRLYVGETHRRHTSVPDISQFPDWIEEDAASRRHEDQVAMIRRRLGARAAQWAREGERIRLLEDTDGDGRADRATTFAEGFSGIGEGLGAGLLARGRDVWYACIPNFWRLRDADGDGKAEERRALHTGYGVRIGINGHDLHGLRWGPDGKIYFSCGDRGFHVETGGRVISNPDSGGVLRCNPDGSDLELLATGLRNPQELVFDQFGNLFTGDNNANIGDDNGETARWIYVVEGADYGWRHAFQWMSRDGPWSSEGLWKGAAPFLVPCVAHLGHGPSGVTFYPGTGLPAKYDHHFFMCDFPGGVWSFAVKPRGAGFEMVDLEKFLWELLPSDVEFGPDGAVYVADWVATWDKTGKGRVFRVVHPGAVQDPAVAEARKLLAEGMSGRTIEELAGLLGHRDQRVRQEAQFELVERGPGGHTRLILASGQGNPRLARLHAIWGLGQAAAPRDLMPLLKDPDAEVRAQAARVLGDRRVDGAGSLLVPLLKDDSPRVRFFAAMGLGRLAHKDALDAVVEFLSANDDNDPFLRHAGVMVLAGMGDVPALVRLKNHGSTSVRLAALLALRRLRRPEVADFLKDPDLSFEAARSINDAPIDAATASLATARGLPEKALSRWVNACFRSGDAALLAEFAARRDVPGAARADALRALLEWEQPTGRDRVTGAPRPLAPRDGTAAREALQGRLVDLVHEAAPEVATEAIRASRALRVPGSLEACVERFHDRNAPVPVRIEALRNIGELKKDSRLLAAVAAALEDKDEALKAEGLRLLGRSGLPDAAQRLEKIAAGPGSLALRQAAVRELADRAVVARLLVGDRPRGLVLDLLEAAGRLGLEADPRPGEEPLLEGGDAEAGRRVFFHHRAAGCARCHWVRMEGGSVGPDLTYVGSQRSREQILESIVLPNKEISPGFEQVILALADGGVEAGKVEVETETHLTLRLADGSLKRVEKGSIRQRKRGLSSMPEDLAKHLSKRELRDLVEYLSTLR